MSGVDIAPDDPYTQRAELERKYTDALANLLGDYEQGNITLEAMRAGFYAVYTTVCGLVDWDDLNEIMAELKQYEE